MSNTERGFTRFIIIVILIVIVLGALSIDIRSIAESTAVKNNLAFVWEIVLRVWGIVLVPIGYVTDIYCSSSLGASVCEAFKNAVP